MAIMMNGQLHRAGVKVTPYVIPHSAGMPTSMVTALTKTYGQVIKLKGQIAASKALGAYAGMREMVATEQALVKAGVPIQTITHGKVIPTTATAKALIQQQQLLTGAQKTERTISTGYLTTTVRTEVLTEKVHGLFEEIAGLKQELRDRPTVTETKLGFDWGLPSFEDIKTPLIIAGAAIAGLFLVGKFIGRKS